MRTTVRLENALLARAKRAAAERGVTLTALIEEGLCLAMRRPLKPSARSAVRLPVCGAGGGTLPGVDLTDSAGVLEIMDGRH